MLSRQLVCYTYDTLIDALRCLPLWRRWRALGGTRSLGERGASAGARGSPSSPPSPPPSPPPSHILPHIPPFTAILLAGAGRRGGQEGRAGGAEEQGGGQASREEGLRKQVCGALASALASPLTSPHPQMRRRWREWGGGAEEGAEGERGR